ncbi:P-II family nitrogen regulator [Ectobacillus sp. JY-23]|uniref:P-II family nitrogen regulator n=1 Tax=Ectobacillus sp. JY-23 TaxID=2933872 RepID=UPI001FF6FA01|nr:P-II family nitrogen regulator [Ectobacillus sp. JY-23]UOY92103.1 P-II family nitrogen regulator [Ectobacillus sp. JY-23]
MSEKLTKIEIITRPTKFEEFKQELAKIGVSGITVSNVLGCGLQKGFTEVYRGVTRQISMHERIKIEIVVCKVPVQDVVDTAKRVLKTGKPGDGKIFIYEITNAIKIRTGEEGCQALQNDEA